MKVYKTTTGIFIESEGSIYLSQFMSWDAFINQTDLYKSVLAGLSEKKPTGDLDMLNELIIEAPIQSQEIWAAGVTYTRSRDARMEESKDAGGGSFYDMVYDAVRPELFFKSTSYRCVGTGDKVRIRKDSTWNVPEPELTLVINNAGDIVGYTIGNDMSSRSIEGENPLYLPQAKSYDGSAAVGPCVFISSSPISPDTKINMQIIRGDTSMFAEETAISKMKRGHHELVEFLFRECTFPFGCLLMTGTCLVPPNDFTLESGDVIIIRIDHIGELKNTVA
ncbi:MAG TPA: fumarylacetoacetate hydrolase family protein [Puia sp.]|nr:fumarylacetoacetate hydrolase family protein [Puia sp.]